MLDAIFGKEGAVKATAAAKALFKNDVRVWREICAAMDLEEQRLQKENRERLESCPYLCLFWWQNLAGLVIESPIRTAYHTTCSFGWVLFIPCFLWQRDSLPERCAGHHYATAHEYYFFLQHVLCSNVRDPRSASLYIEDYRLNRPPRPSLAWNDDKGHVDPGGCCTCTCRTTDGDKCCHDDKCCDECCADLGLLLIREAKSLLCIFSCASSLHPGRCCGPPPIKGCYEDMTKRHERWAAELEDGKKTRTEAFVASYRREDYTFTAMKASRRLVAHRVASGVPVKAPSNTPVPQQQAMQRL